MNRLRPQQESSAPPEVTRIRDQLRRACLGDAWHGPSVGEAAAHFNAQNAWHQVPPSGHNACDIVLHIASWLEIVRARFDGRVVGPADAQDWPPAGARSRESWDSALARFATAYADLDRALAAAADARLEDPAPGRDYTMYVMLHGVIQHSLYHAGQLMLMYRVVEKAVDTSTRDGAET